MEIGMLWYDNSPIALTDRVKQAAGYYTEKYGRKPNLCFVHPDMLQADEGKANGVVIRKGKQIMPGHFWIGVDQVEIETNGARKTGSKASVPNAEGAISKATVSSKTDAAPSKPKAKSAAKTTAKSKTAKKSKPASVKAASAKPASAKPASRKPASAKPKAKTKAKAVKRTEAYLKKKSGSRVEVGSNPRSATKSTKSKAN